jgi:hypothetical protein
MKKLLLPLVMLLCFATSTYAQTSNVTFSVDMSQYGGSTANGVFVNGTWNGWCGSCNPLTDANNDGIWEVTLPIPNGMIEYKFTVDGWTDQENFSPGMSCVLTTGPYTNRTNIITGDIVLPSVCWNSCSVCNVNTTSNVTFSVDMSEYTGSTASGVYIAGTFNSWCNNCNALTDANNDGIWEVTLPITHGTIQYKYTIDGWNSPENLTAGTPCVLTSGGFTNRVLSVSAPTTLPTVCWNSCSACNVSTTSDVTFSVDMSEYTGSTANGVFVNGTWNSWCGSCNPLTDANNDGIWETTLPITNGTIEYKFTVDGWNDQENLSPGMSCVLTTGPYTNRVNMITSDVALPTVCWNSCAACPVILPDSCLVIWTELVGTTLTGSTLTKTTGTAAWNAGARSVNMLAAGLDGWASTEVLETNKNRVFGLSKLNTLTNNKITYGIYLQLNGTVTIFENGTNKGSFGSYAAGDVFKVKRTGTSVQYLKNETVFYTSLTASTTDLYVDVSFNSLNSTIHNCYISFDCIIDPCIVFSANVDDTLNETCAGADDGAATISAVSENVTFDWSDGYSSTNGNRTGIAPGDYTVTVTDTLTGCSTTLDVTIGAGVLCYPDSCIIIWENLSGVSYLGNTFTKTKTTAGWNAAALSVGTLDAGIDGWVEMEALETDKRRVFGLAKANVALNNKLTYAIFLNNNGTVSVAEGGTTKGTFGSYATGDKFRVVRTGTTVTYLHNGNLIYTSTVASTTKLYADFSINTLGGTIHNPYASFGCSPLYVDEEIARVTTNNVDKNVNAEYAKLEALENATIYPNPTSDAMMFNVVFDKEVELNVAIMDVTGRIIETRNTGKVYATQMRFDVSNFAEGVYFVRISAEGQTTTKRFVVVK